MAKSRNRKRAAVPRDNEKLFLFAQYALVVGIYSVLLLSTVLFLPRITFFVVDLQPSQTSSRDKPQHPFFEPLTAQPLLTVTCAVAAALILQAWWVRWVWSWQIALQGPDGGMRKEQSKGNVQRYTDAGLGTLTVSFAIHVILVLFGTPVTSHNLHTFSLACLISVLSVFTPMYMLGVLSLAQDTTSLVNRLTWIRLFVEFSPRNTIEITLVYPVIGTVLGCWCGALPIPLDWDRPWQSWPLTTAFGAVLGHILGQLLALIVNGYTVLTIPKFPAIIKSKFI